MKLIYVKWRDAAYQGGAMTPDKFDSDIIFETAGFLSRETDDAITISLEYEQETGKFRYNMHLPKAYILERKNFE